MSSLHRPLLAIAAAVLLSACGAAPPPPTTRNLVALDAVTSGIMGIPVTTSSADARNHFLQGQRELDLARNFDALDHFKRAVAADSTFALAYLNVANNRQLARRIQDQPGARRTVRFRGVGRRAAGDSDRAPGVRE